MLHARTQVRKKEMDPEPSPPTPSRPERHQRVVVDSSPKASSMSRFQDSVKEVRESVQKALHLLREMSRTSTDSEFKSATEMFQTSIRDANHEIQRMSTSSVRDSFASSISSPVGDLNVEAILDKYSDRLMEKLERKMAMKKMKEEEDGN